MSTDDATAPSAGGDASEINIKVKGTTDTYDLKIDPSKTIGQLKDELSLKVNAPAAQLCVIFVGKILKDEDTIESAGLKEGMAVHMVIRKPKTAVTTSAASSATSAPQPAAAAPTPQPLQQPSPFPAAGGMGNMFAGMGGGMGGGDINAMMQNPEMMRHMMNSPLMQSLLDNPEIMRSMVMQNPQIQQLVETNPEVGHMLNNPDLMRQSLEMIRNPNMFDEMMRSHDRAVSNLQGLPGGMAALQRLYQDVQEPLLDGTNAGTNPFATLRNETSAANPNAGVENTQALPNPWGAPQQPAGTRAPATSANPTTSAQPNMFAGNPGLQNMQQQMMQQMLNNPDLTANMLGPMLGGQTTEQQNAQRDSLRTMLSRMAAQPDASASMSNPRVLQALQQIREALVVLNTEAPQLATLLGLPRTLPPAAALATAPGSTATTNSSTAGGTGPSLPPNLMAAMMNQLAGLQTGGGAPADSRPAEERYRSQLEQLAAMGFVNTEQNIQALTASFGDLNGAVERLLGQQ